MRAHIRKINLQTPGCASRKRLMGRHVLTLQRAGIPKTIRMYAHSTGNSVTVLVST